MQTPHVKHVSALSCCACWVSSHTATPAENSDYSGLREGLTSSLCFCCRHPARCQGYVSSTSDPSGFYLSEPVMHTCCSRFYNWNAVMAVQHGPGGKHRCSWCVCTDSHWCKNWSRMMCWLTPLMLFTCITNVLREKWAVTMKLTSYV